MITLEIGREEDVDEICNLLEILFNMEEEFEPDRIKQKKGVEMIIKNPNIGFIVVIKDCGTIFGMVNILYTVSTFIGEKSAILEDMIIEERYRDIGYGTKLIQRSLIIAKEKGIKRVTLLTDENNYSAEKFYIKNGFIKSNMMVMRKKI